MNNYSLSDRMKEYERVTAGAMMRRTPVIIRVDGRSFSKLTRKMDKPFDHRFSSCMKSLMIRLAADAQGCVLVYQQSDEASFLLIDFHSKNTCAWFDNEYQKIASVSAAVATSAFIGEYIEQFKPTDLKHLPVFDALCYNIPREDVSNYFISRQRDAERNSVNMLAHEHFSNKALHGKSRDEMIEMLKTEKGVDWNKIDPCFQRGMIAIKESVREPNSNTLRTRWVIKDAPKFLDDRDIIDQFMRN